MLLLLYEQRDGSGVHLVDARLAFHSRTPWHISKVLFLMQKYNLFQYTPNISNYNEHWNRPHVHSAHLAEGVVLNILVIAADHARVVLHLGHRMGMGVAVSFFAGTGNGDRNPIAY